MNAVCVERLSEPYPARSTIGVAALPMAARVEIEAIARRRAKPKPPSARQLRRERSRD
jgi:enamine deaminase RidA (YjgF/YER057c/UK114 family)